MINLCYKYSDMNNLWITWTRDLTDVDTLGESCLVTSAFEALISLGGKK